MTSSARNNLHFALAAIVLAGSALFLQAANERGLLRVLKKPLPVRKPLVDLSQSVMAPFKLVSASRLSPETEEELGTKEYVNWRMKGPIGKGGTEQEFGVTISYYTGVQDQVPHVPEECLGAGAFPMASDETLDMPLDRLAQETRAQGHETKTASIRRLSFSQPREIGKRLWVYYTISVNGEFHSGRQGARFKMADSSDTHLYYSKVELDIPAPANANLAELDRAANELFDRLLGELVKSHWPRRGWERGGPPAGSA